jgi:hypothetical protein
MEVRVERDRTARITHAVLITIFITSKIMVSRELESNDSMNHMSHRNQDRLSVIHSF